MPNSCATSGTSSTSILAKWAEGNSSENLGVALAICSLLSVWGYASGMDGEEGDGGGKNEKTHFTTCGAITLHGPHQVANASRTTILLSLMAESNSALLFFLSASTPKQKKSLHPNHSRRSGTIMILCRICSRTREERGRRTNLERLWTPIFAVVLLNPLEIA